MRDTIVDDFIFVGHAVPPVVGSPDGSIWRKAITGAAPPTVSTVAGGMALALTATNEAQNACLYMGDVLNYDIDDLLRVEFWATLTASFAAANTVSFGMASARNDTPESITAFALFKAVGNNNVVVSTDDNVNDITDKATGLTLSTTLRKFVMDFGAGVKSISPGKSVGGKANVLFSMENARGDLRAVLGNTQFDMSQYSSGLQPFAQIQKTIGTTTGTLTIPRIRITRRFGG